MALPEKGPNIITQETQARKHFQELTAAGFTVRARGHFIEEDEFVYACLAGEKVWIKDDMTAGGDVRKDVIEKEALLGWLNEDDLHDTYVVLRQNNFTPYLPGTKMTEETFIDAAAARGLVDLEKIRHNGTTMRTFGSIIGFSNTFSIVIPNDNTPLQ